MDRSEIKNSADTRGREDRIVKRGSEWRKWDLHLHSPGTKLSDAYKFDGGDVWDEYCKRLEESDVQVFGITDYFSADGYFATKEKFFVLYPKSQKVLLPNIELRTNDVVNKAQEEVHVHLIFNPFHADYESRIRSFLQTLQTSKTDAGERSVRASELHQTKDFQAATTTRPFIVAALEATYGKGTELLDRVLILCAANNDGIRPERGAHRKELITDELDKWCDAFFGSAKNVPYFLSPNRAEDKGVVTQRKPVLSGCDAHSFIELTEKLGQTVSNPEKGIVLHPTWIKADPTFEGLKQIIFEPENRVFIGEEPEVTKRVRENKTKYIDTLHIDCVDGYHGAHGTWFSKERISLGKELVAIIGNKGSGKSAVTDIIGLLGNSHNQTARSGAGRPEELFSFLTKEKFLKGGCATHFHGELYWYEGEPNTAILDSQVQTHLPEKVEYLPQKYLERICANIADDEFRSTLNEVIFRYVKRQDQFGQTNLDDLIKYRTQQAEGDIKRKKEELHIANEEVVGLEKKLTDDYSKQLGEKLKTKREELAAHSSARPPDKPKPDDGGAPNPEAAQIDALATKLSDLENQIAELEIERVKLSEVIEGLRQIRQAIDREANSLLGLRNDYKAALEAVGLSFDVLVKLNVDYTALDAVVSQKEQRTKEINALLLTEEDISALTDDSDEASLAGEQGLLAGSLICQKESLEGERKALSEKLGKSDREYHEYLNTLALWTVRDKELRGDEQSPAVDSLIWLEGELQKIGSDYPQTLVSARSKREALSREVYRQRCGLTVFYNEIKKAIDAEIDKCRDDLGEYDIAIEAGIRFNHAFYDDFLRYINLSIAGSYRGQDDARVLLLDITSTISGWENENEVFTALNALVGALHFQQEFGARDVFKQMKGDRKVEDLYDYVFGFDYLDTKYDLKVDQKDLSELSPGERGGLLLVFYLMLDRQDIPLVIDQPEDNLDNKSVYEILVTFIKKAKKRRQIILVTHNPNLAVVADAEQIIHVTLNKKGGNDFDFISGAIEDPAVNRVVVDILEGTMPAFDNRRLKYRRV